MEKETELYLIQRIKELEQEYKDLIALSKEPKEQPIIETNLGGGVIAFFQGHKIDKNTIKKAEAYELLNELMGIEACFYPNEKKI